MDQPFENEDYTIGWICALAVEFRAALAILDERHPPLPQELDDNAYAFGRVGCYNIVIAGLPSGVYGVTSAANVAALLRQNFPSITVGLMVGIGGGAPVLPLRDIRLGDVVVSEPVAGFGGILQYDFGKTIQQGQFVQTGVLNKPPNIFLKALTKLKAEYEPDSIAKIIAAVLENEAVPQEFGRPSVNSDQLFQAHYDHPFENVSCESCDHNMVVERPSRSSPDWPHIHYGLIASGNQVMKHGITRDKLSREKGVICFEMEAAGLEELPSLVIRGICDYADSHKSKEWQPYAALSAAAFARQLLLQLPSRANVKSRRGPSVKLDLPIAEDAMFGNYADQDEPECIPGTRVDLLNRITQWADGPQKCMFWLVGRAGTGKSTISRTVARSFQENGQLGASFFFKRGEADRANAALLFTTIAFQLANRFRSMIPSIQTALEADPSIPRKALTEQFDKLIFRPLREIKPAFNFHTPNCYKPRSIIVIDALDECERKPDTNIIVNLLARLKDIETMDVRVFLTSRPELPIRPAFKRLQEDKYKEFILHEVPLSSIKHDILLFLEHEMFKIREEYQFSEDWPGGEKIQRLAEMAIPLFIYAATLCRFISDEYWDPDDRIKTLLEYQTGPVNQLQQSASYQTGWHTSQLHKTYLPILEQIIVGRDPTETDILIKEFQQIVGAIVNLASPLSISSLARLLSVSEIIVECRLKVLHSVLNVPNDRHTPVRLFHASFRDFLLQGKSQFRIDENLSHQMIGNKCIEIMSGPNGLKRNICCLESPGTFRSEIDKEIIERYLPPELRYACLYWVHHITRAGRLISNDRTHKFLQEHILHWLEVMSLLGHMDETLSLVDALISVTDAESSCLVPGPSTENGNNIHAFFYDMRRFILRNRYIIDKAPLQIYYSAIAFLPTRSLLRSMFKPEKLIKQICDLPKVEDKWDALLGTLKGHNAGVNAVAFSSDGKLLASASNDRTVRLWNALTGAPLQTLDKYELGVTAIVFSSDYKSLASGSYDGTVRLWEVTGAQLRVMRGHTSYVSAIAFSSDGEILVSASNDQTLIVWDMLTETPLHTLQGHTNEVNFVAFSSDSTVLASSSSDGTIRLWDATTWMPLKILEDYTTKFEAIAFSPDGKTLASSTSEYTIILWDAATWAPREISNYENESCSLVFSPDGKYLAVGSLNGRVTLLDANTGMLLETLEGHIQRVCAVAFSPDSKLLASGSGDDLIKLWDVTVRAPSLTLEEHNSAIYIMQLSPDNKLLLSESYHGTVILWDAVSGAFLHTLKGHEEDICTVAFSLDGESLATASFDYTVKLWDVSTGESLQTLQHQGWADAIVFSPDSKLLVSASSTNNGLINLWDAATGKLLQTLKEHTAAVLTIAFSSNGKFLASGSSDCTIKLWDTATWTLLQTLEGHSDSPQALAFSSNNKFLASGSRDFNVGLWDADTGVLLHTLDGRSESYAVVYAVVFSPNNKFLASTSADNMVRLWDVATGALLQNFAIDRVSGLSLLSFSLDGRYINTNGQSFACQPDTAPPGSCDTGQHKVIGLEGEWLTRFGEKIIWLPESVSFSAVYGNVIALGYRSGTVSFFRFDVDF